MTKEQESSAEAFAQLSPAEQKGAMALETLLAGMTQVQRDTILKYLLDNAGKYPMRRKKNE